jgi:hypothetical protein
VARQPGKEAVCEREQVGELGERELDSDQVALILARRCAVNAPQEAYRWLVRREHRRLEPLYAFSTSASSEFTSQSCRDPSPLMAIGDDNGDLRDVPPRGIAKVRSACDEFRPIEGEDAFAIEMVKLGHPS